MVRLVGNSHGNRQRHRNDLRSDDLAFLPAKAVGRSVDRQHRWWSSRWNTVTLKALLFRLERLGNKNRPPIRGFAIPDFLSLVGMVAKIANNIRLPVRGAVFKIRRIERGLPIRVIRVVLAEILKVVSAPWAGTVS